MDVIVTPCKNKKCDKWRNNGAANCKVIEANFVNMCKDYKSEWETEPKFGVVYEGRHNTSKSIITSIDEANDSIYIDGTCMTQSKFNERYIVAG